MTADGPPGTPAPGSGVDPESAVASTPPRSHRSRRLDVVYAGIGTLLQVGTGIIMLPAIAATLSPSELTFWYVFLSIHTLAILLEFGFTPTLSRNFTYVFAGAQTLQSEGVASAASRGPLNTALFANLLRACQRFYLALGAAVFVLLGVGGTLYLHALIQTTNDTAFVWEGWAVFLAALVVQTSLNWQGCLLVGADRQQRHYQIIITARVVQVTLSLIGLYLWPNVLSLAIAYALSIGVSRLLAGLSIADLRRRAAEHAVDAAQSMRILKTIAPNAVKLGWTTLGDFFTTRFALFAVSLAVGAAAAAEYALLMQAMMVLLSVSQIVTYVSMPRMATARIAGDMKAMREYYALAAVASVGLLGAGSVGLILLGEPILRLIGSNTMLPPLPVLILIGAMFTVMVNAHTAMNVITSGNRVPHLRAVLATAAVTTLLTIIAAALRLDLFLIIAIQAGTQLAFNFWRWPVYAFRETGLTLGTLWSSAVAGARRVLLGHA